MKKFLIRAAAVLVLLLLFVYAFLEYRQYRSYSIPVHKDADMILKINADAFIKTWLREYSFHTGKRKTETKKDAALTTGLKIPANIFVYTVKGKQAGTFFTTLAVKSKTDFTLYVSKKFNIQWKQQGALMIGTAGKLNIYCNDEYAAIAWSYGNDDVQHVLADVIANKDILAKSNALFQQLKQSRRHITIATENAGAFIAINGNKMNINGFTKKSGNWIIPGSFVKRNFNPAACAFFFMNAKPGAAVFKKEYRIKQYSFVTDSILKYFGGYADFELNRSATQLDTAITYGYNDNFEMTEQKTVTENKIPQINIRLSGTADALVNYLQRQQIISPVGKLNREAFPLYAVHITKTKNELGFSTGEHITTQQGYAASASFLELMIDFDKTMKEHDFPFFSKYSKGISSLQISATKQPEQLNLRGHIDFEGPVLKTLTALFNL